MKILLVDDDRRLRASLADYFDLVEGWEVAQASSPTEALSALREPGRHFDAVLLDIMMPPDETVLPAKTKNGNDTGLALLDMIAALGALRPKVIILTARQDLNWVVEQGKAAGYVRKTQTPEEIVEAVKAVVRPSSPS